MKISELVVFWPLLPYRGTPAVQQQNDDNHIVKAEVTRSMKTKQGHYYLISLKPCQSKFKSLTIIQRFVGLAMVRRLTKLNT